MICSEGSLNPSLLSLKNVFYSKAFRFLQHKIEHKLFVNDTPMKQALHDEMVRLLDHWFWDSNAVEHFLSSYDAFEAILDLDFGLGALEVLFDVFRSDPKRADFEPLFFESFMFQTHTTNPAGGAPERSDVIPKFVREMKTLREQQPKHYQILALSFAGFTAQEIADLMDCSLSTVNNYLSKNKLHLRTLLMEPKKESKTRKKLPEDGNPG